MTFLRRSPRQVAFLDLRREEAGGKARNLEWLDRRGATVPLTWVIGKPESLDRVPLDSTKLYAVRSSAPDEDGDGVSRAGAYLTELDVPADGVPLATRQVLANAEGHDRMGVLVQEMVHPVVSGVAFSRNPVTGLSDVVVEATEGRGDALLQEGAEPLRWVSRHGSFIEQPAERDSLSGLVQEVVEKTTELSESFGPADLEWVWDGEDIWWVQIRPITAISDVPLFSRRIAKDVLPGLIKPLVWSVNIPMVNAAWIRLFTQAIGKNSLEPEDLASSFAYRAYFDMRAIGDIFEMVGMPRDSLENLLGLPGEKGRMRPGVGSLRKVPRMVALAWRTHRGGNRFDAERAELEKTLSPYRGTHITQLSDEDLLHEIEILRALGVEAAYLNIVVPLTANLYTAGLRRKLGNAGVDFEELPPFDRGETDPGPAVKALATSLSRMDPALRRVVESGDLSALDKETAEQLDRLLHSHGHLSENNNDFSVPRWRDDPSVVIRLARLDDHESDAPQKTWESAEEPLGFFARRSVRRWKHRAASAELRRNEVGSTFALAYGLLRPRFLELGRRLTARAVLRAPDDVFYINADEALLALQGEGLVPLQDEADRVRLEIEDVADLVMPDVIVGDSWVPESPSVEDRLLGVGTSRGRYRGTARFIETLDDAESLGEGEVLVVEYSDVAWTPLFPRAGAVITSAGGMLAHSSITARELGLPCVSSVAKARFLDGATVIVDGYSGEVIVEQHPDR